MKDAPIRFIQYILGLLIKTFGLVLVIRSNLGTGSWEAFYIGLAKKSGLSMGMWVFIIGFILIWFNAFLWKRKPTYSSFLTIAMVGILINCWLFFITLHPIHIGLQMSLFWTGLIVASFGASIYLLSDFTPTPVDQLMFALSYRFQISIMFAKTVSELFALLLAIALHGSIGIGTIIFAFLFGPFIQFFIQKLNRKQAIL
ncbi:YczE/YyaS/YitT family protein [Shimazuella kribbensis]|uniref:YczE/YyaS/YitT family protein n=1 Tax=Shimazuella kribbensis TaxID=139808 RepID=UPI00055F8EB7|nr:hypothetical protein [Shimazuella kribbensis]